LQEFHVSPPVSPLPFEVRLSYCLGPSGDDGPGGADAIHHPLFALLEALRRGGSIGRAAQQLGLSYRHVWGELRRWEADLGRPLVHKVQGQRSVLTPFGERLVELERRIQSRHAARIRALRHELAHVVVRALDESAPSPPRSHSGSPAHPVHGRSSARLA
jgi:putative molybdopterin biosynthesis protein